MPGLNGTGPMGQGPGTGRRFGRCRFSLSGSEAMSTQVQAPENLTGTTVQPDEHRDQSQPQAPVYGAGRGGMPRGCGNGHAFGGGRGRMACRW